MHSADSLTDQLRALSCTDNAATEAHAPPATPTAHADEPPTNLQLLALPRDVLALVVSKLSRKATRVLASTSTASLRTVLDNREGLRTFTVDHNLLRCVSRMGSDVASKERSVLRIMFPAHGQASGVGGGCVMYAPLRGMTLLCSGLHSTLENSKAPPSLLTVPAAAFAGVTKLECDLNFRIRGVVSKVLETLAVLPGMRALAELDASYCKPLSTLPPSSTVALRCLRVAGTSLRSLPPDMNALSELNVSHCALLEPDCLPASSCASLRVLRANTSSLQDLPEGMTALREIQVDRCKKLSAHWLPESSGHAVEGLSANMPNLQQLPCGMAALKLVHVGNCRELDADWLPVSSRQLVTELSAQQSGVVRIPEEMPCLERLNLDECARLSDDWLPPSSAAGIVDLSLVDYRKHTVPAGLTSLLVLDLSRATTLAEDWLPRSSAACILQLTAASSNMCRLPVYMTSLQSVSVLHCSNLASDWLPWPDAVCERLDVDGPQADIPFDHDNILFRAHYATFGYGSDNSYEPYRSDDEPYDEAVESVLNCRW